MIKKHEQSDRLWSLEAANYLKLSRSTLAKWRSRNEGPPFHRCGPRLVYYLKHEIDAWLIDCDQPSSGEQRTTTLNTREDL